MGEDKKETQELNKESQMKSNKTSESKEALEALETPLQKELKKNLKSHLNTLSKELQDKNLNDLHLEQNTGLQKHVEHFESLYGRKDIPKNNNSDKSLNQKIQKAYDFQQERIEKLRQKNDEIGK